MAKALRTLVCSGSARELQQKLECWHQNYELNTTSENMSRCCEALELNTAIQKQLYSILNETSQNDTIFEGTIKSCPPPSLCCTTSDVFPQDSNGGELHLRDLSSSSQLQELEGQLTEARSELSQMQQDMRASCVEDCKTLKRLQQLNDYEQQIQLLQDEIAVLDGQKCVLQSRLSRSRSPHRSKGSKGCCLSVQTWPPAQPKRACASRRACLIARFNFIYAKERLDAECRLRSLVCDMETVQRIIYTAAVESFHAAKMAFRKIKITVKETLALDHCGPSLESAALDYIACHKDLYDVRCSVQEVICCLSKNPKLPCPSDVDFSVINCLIRELCCLAFQMQTICPPLDIAIGVDGELFNRTKYYRSCDSDFSACCVAYHVWPALMEGDSVIVKGEVVTKKIVMVTRSRSLSAVRVKSSKC